ncbi:hypothetical protein [Flagellimonas onchidii]|uniref:hypothetical protein n=1 Tax=Flagellimonas onchidii TaxID=2562684 RepID=UPI0010A62C11|nr:hypothetical protein [Allomuricauda onchidii]
MLALVFLIGFTSCNQKVKSDKNQTSNHSDNTIEQHPDSKDKDFYCEIAIGNVKERSTDFSLKTTPGPKQGSIMTHFDIYLNEEIPNQYPSLKIDMTLYRQSESAQLEVGTYKLGALLSLDTFSFDSVWDMDTYKNAVEANNLDGIMEDYVLVPDESNQVIIESVSPSKAKEDAVLFEEGSKIVTGTFEATLLKVSTKEKTKLKVKFKVNHNWML